MNPSQSAWNKDIRQKPFIISNEQCIVVYWDQLALSVYSVGNAYDFKQYSITVHVNSCVECVQQRACLRITQIVLAIYQLFVVILLIEKGDLFSNQISDQARCLSCNECENQEYFFLYNSSTVERLQLFCLYIKLPPFDVWGFELV